MYKMKYDIKKKLTLLTKYFVLIKHINNKIKVK